MISGDIYWRKSSRSDDTYVWKVCTTDSYIWSIGEFCYL